MRLCDWRTPILLGVLSLTPGWAQNIHIESVTGHVSVLRGDEGGELQRGLNATLVTGDRIVTAENAQAQVAIDAANALQVGGSSEVRLAEIYPGRYQMILEKGSMAWTVNAPSAADAEIVTPSVAVRPRHPGAYDVVLNDSGETEIVPRTGSIEVFGPTGSQWVDAGQKMIARGPADNPEFQIVAAMSRWKRFWRSLANLQFGVAVASSVASSVGGEQGHKPLTASTGAAYNSGGSKAVRSPESGHPPAGSGHSHSPSGSSGGGHSSPVAAVSHSASSSSGGGSHASSSSSGGGSHK